jgi:aspartyl-tRNA(Asn)/glutamyl-tRNA(Gln) amidotransferase subunit A
MTIANNLTIKEAAEQLRAGTLTSVELTTEMVNKAKAYFDSLGAYVEITEDLALEQAAAADADFKAGTDKGALQGIPLAVKDIIAMIGAPTTANSRVLDPAWGPAQGDAPVVARLREAGAVFVGKATTSEFACGNPDETKGFPIPRNPWDTTRTPAGSSSGTGIAVVAGLALGGLGTDTGGSVRGPATVNGHSGLKVTYGRVPKSGVVPLGYSLDSIGPMARSAYDCAVLLGTMAGWEPKDPNVAKAPVDDYVAALTGDVSGLKIGLPTEYFFDHPLLDPEVKAGALAAVESLVGLGATSEEFVLPHAELAKDANSLIMIGEAQSYHKRNLQTKWSSYGKWTRANLVRGAIWSASDFSQANRFRQYWSKLVAQAFEKYDVLITPSAPTPAQRPDEITPSKRLLMPSYTGQWNLTGLPALCVPTGFSASGLPLSMQIIGKPFAEATVLKVADAFQRITDYHVTAPSLEGVPSLVGAPA